MKTDRAAQIAQGNPAAKASEGLVKRLDAYLRGLEVPAPGRSKMIETVLNHRQSESGAPTMAEAMAELHVQLAQASAGPASVRASAAQRTAMWFDAARHAGSVDPSIYLKRPLIKRMAMLPAQRPQVIAEGTWRRLMRLYIEQ